MNPMIPEDSGWNPWWIVMWWTTTITWVTYSIVVRDFTRGASAFVVLFLVPELISIAKSQDNLPPLTHVIRSTFRNVEISMPLITGASGAVIASWTNTTLRLVGFAGMASAALGWLIAHFLNAYAAKSPRVSTAQEEAGTRLA